MKLISITEEKSLHVEVIAAVALMALNDGEAKSRRNILNRVVEIGGVNKEELLIKHKKLNRSKLDYTLSWALSFLVKTQLVQRQSKSVYCITQKLDLAEYLDFKSKISEKRKLVYRNK